MKIVAPYAKIMEPDELACALRRIEYAARISHRSEDESGLNTERFIRAVVLQHGDWSVTEHVSASVEFLVDRGITHEIVRHRIASYTQESTRFVNYAKKMPPSFIYPREGDPDPEWVKAIKQCEASYRALLDKGWRPQEARSVFPNALSSKIIVTFNLRTWRHFFLMRTSKEAHPQMRQVTIPLLAEFQRLVPVLYEDIVPESRQVDNIARGR
jgi:thymidylate synthase (FAD)